MAQLIGGEGTRSVLDYGCGDGRLAKLLSEEGIAVTAYDPYAAAIRACSEREGPLEYGGKELLYRLLADTVRFDNVVCREPCYAPFLTKRNWTPYCATSAGL